MLDSLPCLEAFTNIVSEFAISEMRALGISRELYPNCMYTFTKTRALQQHDYARVRDTGDLLCVMGNHDFVADFCAEFGDRVVAVCIVEERRKHMPLLVRLWSLSCQSLGNGSMHIVINLDDMIAPGGGKGAIVKAPVSSNGHWIEYCVEPRNRTAFEELKAVLDKRNHRFAFTMHVMSSRPQRFVWKEMASLGLLIEHDPRCKMLFVDNESPDSETVADWKPPLASTFDRVVKPTKDDFLFVIGGQTFIDSFTSYGEFGGRMLTYPVTPDHA
jgi:hypothetical protein